MNLVFRFSLLTVIVFCLSVPILAGDRFGPFWTTAYSGGYGGGHYLLPDMAADGSGYSDDIKAGIKMRIVDTPTDGGIREEIPDKYKERFEKWKAEFLSTEFGRSEWGNYANNKRFILTFKVSSKRDKGAGTDDFLWDDTGKFVGATITLGDDLNNGFPDPIYYPVLNSLSAGDEAYSIGGGIIAATKISHEIGHVNQTAAANKKFIETQNELVPVYISIFLKNGRNTKDKKLVELAEQMGGTPIEIWESREYWSEVTAMRYLNERISKENFYCVVFKKIRRNIETYAKSYENRFDQYPEFSQSPCVK